ncbi:MAG: FAD-dependent oxidoreductase [Desulfobacterales bacterium]|nr:FAD-dependent oxidoreductase [Desulfobacterales bacterium]
MKTIETLIIGGGLSGLYAAGLLAEKNLPFILLEARERIGGRILSIEHKGFFTDMGPSWYWPEINPKLTGLIRSLGIHGYPQFEEGLGRLEHPNGQIQTVKGFATEPVSWRINGGMQSIVNKLAALLPEKTVKLKNPVCEIEKAPGGALVRVGELELEPINQFMARRIILAIPPRLAAATILFTPDIPHHLTQAMLRTGTWMAGQAKFFTLYDVPCWRKAGLSGQAFSQRGPLGEIHDGSSQEEGPYGLTGFLGIPAFQRKDNQSLTRAILDQLASIYGDTAAQPTAFYYQDWAREKYTATEFDQPPMYEHPIYQPPAGQISIWDGIIHFAGTETADRQGGYLEGALVSAQRAVDNIYPS